ncbi:membrane protein insertion efficiency factor YidD [Patescibacteria group bacterium]|nr:membrane protein insertion efficiency factor YidD [Patescibacteria group bacterium]
MKVVQKSIRTMVTIPIILYQKTLSFDHGLLRFLYPYGYCQFYPSCSEYCRQAILKRGVLQGLALGGWRVLRCHPWSKGGIDRVEEK